MTNTRPQRRRRDCRHTGWCPRLLPPDITWVPARELPSDRVVQVPASLIYLQFSQHRAEDTFTPATSNGLAAGPTLDYAVLHGLYECIERDAFLVTWMARLPAPEVHFTTNAPLANSIRTHYRRFGVDVRVFGLQPIHFGWGEERLGGTRLFELPHKLGFAPAPLTESDLNPCPHPLA